MRYDCAGAGAGDAGQDETLMPKIYIAGPMTGLPEFNVPAFHAAAAAWRAVGWEVLNPAESFGGDTTRTYREYAKHDMALLLSVDAIAMLPGWDGPNARGSVWEREIAILLGATVFDATQPIAPIHKHHVLPTDAAARKAVPLVRGFLDYFSAACAEVAHVSKVGNDQHNPGEEMHHARGKSTDHADCIVRHLMERGTKDVDGLRHSAKVAWRALALLQEELEAAGAPLARGAKLPTMEA